VHLPSTTLPKNKTMQATETAPEIRQIGRITLDAEELTYLWAIGVLNDVAYIAFALQVDKRMYKSMKTFNSAVFAERWMFAGDENGISAKILKPKQIKDAIHKLETVDFIKVEQQLSLELNY
jgi:hypothetical protein